MFKFRQKHLKIKTDIRLACERLKILQARKAELAEKQRKEIADYINKEKFTKAKIKAQTVLRYEATVEAMELIEMLCRQLLDSFGIFKEKKKVDSGLAQIITSLIWVTPYLQHEVKEFKDIKKRLTAKYGSKFTQSALKNKQKTVHLDLIHKVNLLNSSEDKVYKCLRDIAEKYEVSKEMEEALFKYLIDSSAQEKNIPRKYFHSLKEILNDNFKLSPETQIELEDITSEYVESMKTGIGLDGNQEKIMLQNNDNIKKLTTEIYNTNSYNISDSNDAKINVDVAPDGLNSVKNSPAVKKCKSYVAGIEYEKLYPDKRELCFGSHFDTELNSDSKSKNNLSDSSFDNENRSDQCSQCIEELPPSYSSVVHVDTPGNLEQKMEDSIVDPSCPDQISDDGIEECYVPNKYETDKSVDVETK